MVLGREDLDLTQLGLPFGTQRAQLTVHQLGRLGLPQTSPLDHTHFMDLCPDGAKLVALCGDLLETLTVAGDSVRGCGEDLERGGRQWCDESERLGS